jgi:hypothetical protein
MGFAASWEKLRRALEAEGVIARASRVAAFATGLTRA